MQTSVYHTLLFNDSDKSLISYLGWLLKSPVSSIPSSFHSVSVLFTYYRIIKLDNSLGCISVFFKFYKSENCTGRAKQKWDPLLLPVTIER